MTDSIAMLARYFGVSIRAQLQYRASFLLSVAGQFLNSAIEFFGLWALFDRFGHLADWSFAEVALFYGVINCTFAIADALTTGFARFGSHYVKTGNFDRLLLRPRPTALQLAGHEFALRRIGRLLQGLIVLAWAISALDIPWDAARVALLLLTVAGGVAFFFGLMVLQASLCFWTTESLEIMNVLTYGGVETAQYPLSIYHVAFRRIFTFVVPLGCIGYFPIVAVLGVDDPLGTGRVFQALAPLAGVAFLGLSFVAWGIGVRRYTSTGS